MTGNTKTELIPADKLPSKEDIKAVKDFFKNIDSQCEKMQKMFQTLTQNYFDAGKIILTYCENYHGKLTKEMLESAFKSNMRRINTAVKIFKTFRENPAMIENLTMTDAMRLVREKENGTHEKIGYAGPDDGQMEFDWEGFFNTKPVAKVKLENYRIYAPDDHDLYLVQRGINNPLHIAEFYITTQESDGLKLAHEQMLKDMQAAAEKYFSAYEKEQVHDTAN